MWNVKSSCRRILHQFVEVSYKHNTEVTAMDLAMELWSPVVIQLLTRIPESPPSHPSWKGNGFCPSWIVLGSSACSDYALFWTLMWTCYVAHTWCRIFRLDATVMVSIWGSRSNLDYERNIVCKFGEKLHEVKKMYSAGGLLRHAIEDIIGTLLVPFFLFLKI